MDNKIKIEIEFQKPIEESFAIYETPPHDPIN